MYVCREPMNMVIVLKAMGAEADQEIMQLSGNDEEICSLMVTTIQDAKQHKVFTQIQALEFLGGLLSLMG
jgi:DNA-directed RNA polymerase beta subunit